LSSAVPTTGDLGVKFIAWTTIADILPFFKTKLRDMGMRSHAGTFIFVMAAASAFSLPGMFT